MYRARYTKGGERERERSESGGGHGSAEEREERSASVERERGLAREETEVVTVVSRGVRSAHILPD